MEFRIWAGIAVAIAAPALAVAATPHQQFDSNVRQLVLAGIAATPQWVSDCYLADNGLGAILSVRVSESGLVALSGAHFLDRACTRGAGSSWSETRQAGFDGADVNAFTLPGDTPARLVRESSALRLEQGGSTIHLHAGEK